MTKPYRSLGIDPSTSATGIVLLQASSFNNPDLLVEREIKPKDSMKGMVRLRFICTEVMKLVHNWEPEQIVIEGYSLNTKHASSIIPLVELGGMLRFMFHIDNLQWMSPRASTVKKFVTGTGNAAKDKVMMHVLKKWGHESLSNNTADAYALAAMGLAKGGKLQVTKDQQKVVSDLPYECN